METDWVMRAIEEQLRRARRIWRWRHRVAGAVWSATTALVVFAALTLARPAFETGTWEAIASGIYWWSPLLVMFAGMAVTEALLWIRAPSLDEVAQWADRRLGLKDWTTAALEVWHEGPRNRVERALLWEGRARRRVLVPSSVVPTRLKRSLAYTFVPLLMSIPLAVYTAGDPSHPERVKQVPHEQEVTSKTEGSEDLERDLRRASELVAHDARHRRDPYLSSQAQSLSQLADAVSTEGLTSGDIAEEIASTVERLGQYYGVEPASLQEGSESQDEPLGGNASEPDPSSPPAPDDGGAADDEDQAELSGSESPEGSQLNLDVLLDYLEEEAGERVAQDEEPQGDDVQFREATGDDVQGDYSANPELEAANELILDAAGRMLAEEAPPNAVARDGAGPGDAAGQETQELFGDPETPELGDDAEGQWEDVELPWSRRAAGRRFRVLTSVEARINDPSQADAYVEGEWSRQSESAMHNVALGHLDRSVVSRYFLPEGEGGVNAPLAPPRR